jgi:DNA polymerase-3 subunit delta
VRLKRPEELPRALEGGLAPVYLITGDEPLLVQEAADAVRAAARGAGVDEREVFHVESGFDWGALLESAGSLSLFASRRLLEVRLASAAVGTEGAKALTTWAEGADGTDVMLVTGPRLDARAQKAKWVTTLERCGVFLPVWPVELGELPRWLAGRLRRAGVAVDEEGLALLASRVEGNLLAAAQTVERLALVPRAEPWSAAELLDVLDDDARYTPFELADRMLAGDAEHAHRILATLRQEGTEPLALVGILARELRQLQGIRAARDAGEPVDAVLGRLRVIRRRQGLVRRAVDRLPPPMLEGALRDLAVVDQAVKGLVALDPWDELDRLVLRLAGVRTTPLGVRARTWLDA